MSEGVTKAGVVGREEAGVEDVTLTVSIEHSELKRGRDRNRCYG